MKYQFCFDLHFEKALSLFVPIVYVVEGEETIEYVDKKAVPAVLKSFGIDVNQLEPDLKIAIDICKSLEIPSILKKFSTKKKFKSCEELLQDSTMEKGVLQYLHFQLDHFLKLAQKNDFKLSIHLDADKNFAKHQISISKEPLKPHLVFEKTNTELHYSLFLKENNQLVAPMNALIIELRNKSEWIVFNKKLVRLEGIDSKNLIPFLKKETIHVPVQNMALYFEKFIKNIAKKVDFEASGFETILKNNVTAVQLQLQEDFFSKEHFISLQFGYEACFFDFEKTKNKHTELDLSDFDHIKVIQYVRNNEQENQWIQVLEQFGLKQSDKKLFGIENQIHDEFKNLQWLIENKQKLEESGFEIGEIKIKGKPVLLDIPEINNNSVVRNDWFDIEMRIISGNIEIEFREIINLIKEKNRLYLLPIGTYFLIPLEWFTTYGTLVKMIQNQGDRLLLPKNNFMVLEGITSFHSLPLKDSVDFVPSSLFKATLRPYQLEGVKWLWNHFQTGLGACLADDMGLGKTLQTLALLVAVNESFTDEVDKVEQFDLFGNQISSSKTFLKTLIILPSSLVFNWYNEAKKFTPHFKILQYIGSERKALAKKIDRYDLILTTYSVAVRDYAVLEKYHFNYIILDESQYIKNKNSETFKKINLLNTENKISISGTPIENSLADLWSQMQFINPGLLGSYDFFVKNFKNPIEKNKDENGLLELKTLIKPYVLRRTKEQVLSDLPEKTEQIFYCEMEKEQAKLYEEEKSKARNFLLAVSDEKKDKISIINTLMRLRQLSNHPKMIDVTSEMESGKYTAVTNYLETLIQSGHKTIIFSSFISNLAFYEKWCKERSIDFCKLTGETKPADREYAVKRFQENEQPLLFFISLKAGGVGLTITKASYVLFLDPWWNPFAEQQGIGRAHRIGQENKVNVIRFITKNTVEEKIVKLQESKKIMSNSLLEDNFISEEIEKHLDFILE